MEKIFKKLRKISQYKYFPLFFLAFIELGFYMRLILNDHVSVWDDQTFMGTLIPISNISQYLDGLTSGRIPDIQPFRDLTFFLNFALNDLLGFTTYHLFNVLIWIGILLGFNKILVNLNFGGKLRLLCLGLILANPFYVWSVGWIWARKHLLACLFIILSTERVVSQEPQSKKNAILINLYFFIACFSQPIGALFPLWWAVYLIFIRKIPFRQLTRLFIPLSFIFLFVLALNDYYYKSPIFTNMWGQKLMGYDLGTSMLAFGRQFINFIYPFSLSMYYYQGSTLNLIGLILLTIICLWTLKGRNRNILIWLSFWFCPLLITNSRISYIFIFNTYSLIGSFGLMVSFLYLLQPLYERGSVYKQKIILILAFAIGLIFSFFKWSNIYVWEDSDRMFQHSLKHEAPAKFYEIMAEEYFRRSDFTTTRQIVRSLYIFEESDFYDIERKYSLSVFYDGDFNYFRKEGELRFFNQAHSVFPSYIEAIILGEQNYKYPACQKLLEMSATSKPVLPNRMNLDFYNAELDYYCGFGFKNCLGNADNLEPIISKCTYYEYRYRSLENHMCWFDKKNVSLFDQVSLSLPF